MKHTPMTLKRNDRLVMLFLLTLALAGVGTMLFLGGDGAAMLTPVGDSTAVAEGRAYRQHAPFYQGETRRERFAFDPNTADSNELLNLGLQAWQVRNIYRYRAKGGVYRRPEDFARLYGLTKRQYEELRPYIRIASDYEPAADYYASTVPRQRVVYERDTTRHYASPHKLKPTERVELNAADTAELQRVPAIGSYFARRIVAYRQRLGGFYSVEQLGEIDDFPAEAVPYFVIDPTTIHKLNVNRLTLAELKRHPYINYYQAKAIADYRRLRGPLKSLDDLRLCKDFPPEEIKRLEPYVTF